MSRPRTLRKLIWVSLGIQFAGLVFEYAWHGLNLDFKPVTAWGAESGVDRLVMVPAR